MSDTEVVLFDDVVQKAKASRDMLLEDRNPLRRHGQVLETVDGREVYDFGIEESKPAVSASTSLWGPDTFDISQAASSVVLVVDRPAQSCEIHFDTIGAEGTAYWDRLDDPWPPRPGIGLVPDVKRFVDFIDREVDMLPDGSVPGDYALSERVRELFVDADVFGGGTGRAGAGHPLGYGMVPIKGNVMSTVIKVDGRRAENLLERLIDEPTLGGARTLLAEFACGYPAKVVSEASATVDYGSLEDNSDRMAWLESNGLFLSIKDALVSERYDECQQLFDKLMAEEANRGHVKVEHAGFYLETSFDMEDMTAFLRDNALDQLSVIDVARDGMGGYGRLSEYSRTSAYDEAFVDDKRILDVMFPGIDNEMSELDKVMMDDFEM